MTIMKMIRLFILTFIILTISVCKSRNQAAHLNLIYISMDTTRYDYIDCGWQAKSKTPALKNFSERAQTFEKAFVTIPETLPSHLSIFTSYYPHQLRVTQNHSRYNGNHKLIQEILKENGYHTYGIISLMSLIEPGFWKGFDEFNTELCSKEVNHLFLTADKISFHAQQKLEALHKKKFFMFIHFSDPHYPYGPPTIKANMKIYQDDEEIDRINLYKGKILTKIKLSPGKHRFRFETDHPISDFQGIGLIELTPGIRFSAKSANIKFRKDIFSGCHFLTGQRGWLSLENDKDEWIHLQVLPKLTIEAARNMYRLEVEYMDKYIGQFLRRIEDLGLLENTIIAIFADHGEGLGEQEELVGHVEYLNQQFIRVPLMIHIPGEPPRTISTPVSMTGLSSTVLELLNLRSKNFQHSFLNLLNGNGYKKENIFSFTYLPGAKTNKISVIKWPYQGIYYWTNKTQIKELYNLNQNESFSSLAQIDQENSKAAAGQFFSLFLSKSLQYKKRISQLRTVKRHPDRKKLENLRRLGYIN